jgi:hypothetical protein
VSAQAISTEKGSGKLNVLLHGAIAFVKEETQIQALIPRFDHHVYRAGNWLAETDLRGRSEDCEESVVYKLFGVERADKVDIPADNLVLKFEGLPPKPVPYATIKFPLPSKITSLRIVKVDSSYFTHREDLAHPGAEQQHMATLQVFTYGIDKENELRLGGEKGGGHYWEPAFTENYVNLHIFASEDHFYKPSNAREDIEECLQLLGVETRLNTQFLPAGDSPDPRLLPDGVAAEETESLRIRTQRMARLGRLIKQNRLLNKNLDNRLLNKNVDNRLLNKNVDPNLVWHGNDALDGDDHACGDAWVISSQVKTH